MGWPAIIYLTYLGSPTSMIGSPHLSCKRDQRRDYMDRRVTTAKRVTSPTSGPPPLCKKALKKIQLLPSKNYWGALTTLPSRSSRFPRFVIISQPDDCWWLVQFFVIVIKTFFKPCPSICTITFKIILSCHYVLPFFTNRNFVVPAQAEYSYLSVDFRGKKYSWTILKL